MPTSLNEIPTKVIQAVLNPTTPLTIVLGNGGLDNKGYSCRMSQALRSKTEESKPAKPFLKWAGGKSQLLSELIARIPDSYSTYHEPMIGGGAMFFTLSTNGKRAVISDLSEELINCYKMVKSQPDDLIVDLQRHEHSEEYYYKIRSADRLQNFKYWSTVERASRFIYLNKTCFNGLYRVNSKGEFNVPFGKYANPKFLDPENLYACSKSLETTKVKVAGFQSIVDESKSGDFVYFDPPYDPISTTASFTSYQREGFGIKEQKELRNVCVELDKRGVQFMLSNSYTTLILDLYKNFRVEKVSANRAINSKASKRGKLLELVVRNY